MAELVLQAGEKIELSSMDLLVLGREIDGNLRPAQDILFREIDDAQCNS